MLSNEELRKYISEKDKLLLEQNKDYWALGELAFKVEIKKTKGESKFEKWCKEGRKIEVNTARRWKAVYNYGQRVIEVVDDFNSLKDNLSFEHFACVRGIAKKDLNKSIKFLRLSLERNYTVKELRKEIRNMEIQDLLANISKLPEGIFQIVVIDPPWKYGTEYNEDSRRVASKYGEMSIEDIKKEWKEKIQEHIDSNCVLWLWVTNAFIHEAYHLLEEWKFEPKTILTWDKVRMGIGVWLRGQTEHCIMAVKGKPLINLTNETTLLRAKATTHSTKPEEFYKLVDKLCIGRKLDWFATKNRKGWVSYGTLEKNGGGNND